MKRKKTTPSPIKKSLMRFIGSKVSFSFFNIGVVSILSDHLFFAARAKYETTSITNAGSNESVNPPAKKLVRQFCTSSKLLFVGYDK